MTEAYTESERRLRAVVRAALSPGVWLVVGAQLLAQLALQSGLESEAASPDSWRLIATALLLSVFVYLQAGAFAAIARGRERLTVGETLAGGRAVLAKFVWLFVKAGLLFAAAAQVFVLLLATALGVPHADLVLRIVPSAGPLLGVLGFVFVYWMPVVFVRQEFRLLPSWRLALAAVWRRFSRSGFPAFLTLTPALVALLLPLEHAVLALPALSLAGGFMGWIAYIYCAEWLQDHPPTAPTAS